MNKLLIIGLITLIAFVSLSVLAFYRQCSRVEEFLLQDHPFVRPPKSKPNGKIFVNIASYRDPETPKTVENLIQNAEFPDLLRIVVYEQNGPNDSKVKPHPNVEVFSDHFSKAKGPVWARYLIQQLYAGEEYYLQIDSHTRVVEHWDTKLIKMLKMLPDKSVLTQYPPEYNISDNSFDTNQIRSGLYIQGFGVKDRFTRVQSDIIKDDRLKQNYPYTSKGWAACFSFSKGDIAHDAPYDPWLPYLFFGEELDITIRLWTRGWNFYSPNESLLFTTFKRTHRRTFWQDANNFERVCFEASSRKRLCKRLEIPFYPEWFYKVFPINPTITDKALSQKIREFSLGDERTLSEYLKFADIDSLKEQKLNSKAKSFKRFTRRPLRR